MKLPRQQLERIEPLNDETLHRSVFLFLEKTEKSLKQTKQSLLMFCFYQAIVHILINLNGRYETSY